MSLNAYLSASGLYTHDLCDSLQLQESHPHMQQMQIHRSMAIQHAQLCSLRHISRTSPSDRQLEAERTERRH